MSTCTKVLCRNKLYSNSDVVRKMLDVKKTLRAKGVINFESHPDYTKISHCKKSADELESRGYFSETECKRHYPPPFPPPPSGQPKQTGQPNPTGPPPKQTGQPKPTGPPPKQTGQPKPTGPPPKPTEPPPEQDRYTHKIRIVENRIAVVQLQLEKAKVSLSMLERNIGRHTVKLQKYKTDLEILKLAQTHHRAHPKDTREYEELDIPEGSRCPNGYNRHKKTRKCTRVKPSQA